MRFKTNRWQSLPACPTPTLGTTFGLQGSARRVLFVEGQSGPLYLRGLAFGTYARGRWGPGVQYRHFATVTPSFVGAFARGKEIRVTRLADADGLLFAPLEASGIRPLQQEDLEWASDASGPLRAHADVPSDYEYVPPGGTQIPGPWDAPLAPGARAQLLQVPDDIDPRVRVLAAQIGGSLADPQQKIYAVQRYLPANHAYSLTFTAGPGDPLSNFLLGNRAAHCEYFASATVILLRCLRVPARYVTGYYAHEGEESGVAVRQRDAHAWAEAWIDGKGWQTVDSTPADGRPDELFRAVSPWQRWTEQGADNIRHLRNWIAARKPWQVWLTLGTIAALYLGITAWRETRLNQSKKTAAFAYSSPQELAELALRFEAVLRRASVPCPPGRTWEEHLRRLAQDQSGPPAALDLDRAGAFVRAYNAARFGDSPGTDEDLGAQLEILERAVPMRALALAR